MSQQAHERYRLVEFRQESSIPSLQIEAAVARKERMLELIYVLSGPLHLLSLPNENPFPQRRDHLWENTCFECFFTYPGTDHYWEVNASPSGDWNLFEFDSYRTNKKEHAPIRGITFVREQPNTESISFRIEIELPMEIEREKLSALTYGLTAVIKTKEENHSYWAIKHSGQKPDFHLRESFTAIAR